MNFAADFGRSSTLTQSFSRTIASYSRLSSRSSPIADVYGMG
ncbi:MAG: hypothetical protein ACLUSP_11340 [Christensenellales bacterium]